MKTLKHENERHDRQNKQTIVGYKDLEFDLVTDDRRNFDLVTIKPYTTSYILIPNLIEKNIFLVLN